jgi:hypothetical protein
VANEEPDVICIAAIPPGGRAHTRYLCKRLHARFPDLRIIVGRWAASTIDDTTKDELGKAGVTAISTTLLETRQTLQSFFPLLAPGRPDSAGSETDEARQPVKSSASNSRGSLHRVALKEVAARALP